MRGEGAIRNRQPLVVPKGQRARRIALYLVTDIVRQRVIPLENLLNA